VRGMGEIGGMGMEGMGDGMMYMQREYGGMGHAPHLLNLIG